MEKSKWKSDPALVGENIKKRRKEMHMTQKDLADEMGGAMNDKVISLYERGEREMGIQTFFDIAEALETTPNTLSPERLCLQGGRDPRMDEVAAMFDGLDDMTKNMAFQSMKAMLLGFTSRAK